MAQYNDTGAPHYVLQDANYNVVGLTNSSGQLIRQYSFGPYGQMTDAEYGSGNPIDLINDPEALLSPFGYQTTWHDPETGLIHFRNRYYDPVTGRWYSADRNETGLLVASVLLSNAQTMVPSATFTPGGQYADGLSPYQFVRSNPVTSSDPGGLFTTTDMLITAGVAGGLYGLANDYAHYRDYGSKWRLGFAFAKGAGFGTGAALGFGWLTGALASYAGVSAATASATIGMIVSPSMLGLAIVEAKNAETYADRLMAIVDIGIAGVGVAASRAAAYVALGDIAIAGGRGYNSFAALKADLGPAGPTKAWHHIVEQNPTNLARFGPRRIHNTKNVIRLENQAGGMHKEINAHYSSIQPYTDGQTVRQWLSTQSFDEQYRYGIRILKKVGGDPSKIGK